MTTSQSKEDIEFCFFLQKMREQSIRSHIILIEVLSILLTIFGAVLTSYLAYIDYSMTALAISIDNFLDILAYTVIVWRYIRSDEINSDKRDTRANLILSVLFIFSAVCIEYESARNLLFQQKPIASGFFVLSSVLQSITFSMIAIIKFYLAQKLITSQALTTSGINSLICGFSYFSMALGMSAYVVYPSIWYLDSLFGFCTGLLVFVYGSTSFIKYACTSESAS